MVVFDASFLILAFDEQAITRLATPGLGDRINLLLETLQKSKTRIIIPTPALSEFLARADIKLLDRINTSSAFRIVSFDQRAAIEAAEMTRKAIRESDKKDPVLGATWAKIKFDRQIVAIAKVENASTIYSTDGDVAKHAKQIGITCLGIADLPLAPTVQLPLGLESQPATTEGAANVEEKEE